MSLHVCSLLGENKAILLDRFDHDCFHLYSLQSRYDLGTNFPMFLNLSNSRDIFPWDPRSLVACFTFRRWKNIWYGLVPWTALSFFGVFPMPDKGFRTLIWKGQKKQGKESNFSVDFPLCTALPLHYHCSSCTDFSFFVGFVVYPLNINEARESDCSFLHGHFGSVSRPKLKLFMRLLRKFSTFQILMFCFHLSYVSHFPKVSAFEDFRVKAMTCNLYFIAGDYARQAAKAPPARSALRALTPRRPRSPRPSSFRDFRWGRPTTSTGHFSSVFPRSSTNSTRHTAQRRGAQPCNGSRSSWTTFEFSSQCRRTRSWTCC